MNALVRGGGIAAARCLRATCIRKSSTISNSLAAIPALRAASAWHRQHQLQPQQQPKSGLSTGVPVTRSKRKRAEPTPPQVVLDAQQLAQLAADEMVRVTAAVERMKEDNDMFEVTHDHGKQVSINLGPKVGVYEIRFVRDLGVLQLASPRSGGFMYTYNLDTRKWVGRDDGHDFEGMLTRDLIQQANGYPDF